MATPDCTILAFDYGKARTGVAIGNSLTGTASPLTTINSSNKTQRWEAIDHIVEQWRPGQLLLGLPVSAAKQAPEFLGEIKNFGKRLQSRYDLPVALIDESNSSVEANQRLKYLRQQGRKKKLNKQEIDQHAAVIILERWMDEKQHAE